MKEFCNFINSITPMAEPVFLSTGHLGKSNFISLGNEDRIISKPRFSPWLPSYTTFGVAEKSFDSPVRTSHRHTTNEAGSSFVVRDIF